MHIHISICSDVQELYSAVVFTDGGEVERPQHNLICSKNKICLDEGETTPYIIADQFWHSTCYSDKHGDKFVRSEGISEIRPHSLI